MTDSLIREIEALRVGPDEVLIVRLSRDPAEEGVIDDFEAVREALSAVGLGDRSIVFLGDVEFAVAPRDPSTEGEPR